MIMEARFNSYIQQILVLEINLDHDFCSDQINPWIFQSSLVNFYQGLFSIYTYSTV